MYKWMIARAPSPSVGTKNASKRALLPYKGKPFRRKLGKNRESQFRLSTMFAELSANFMISERLTDSQEEVIRNSDDICSSSMCVRVRKRIGVGAHEFTRCLGEVDDGCKDKADKHN
jgi:hypothetical protein